MTLRLVALALLTLGAAGCKGCHDDHPYVPYSITTDTGGAGAIDAASGAPSAAVGAGDAGNPFAGEAAVVAPAGATVWPVDDVVLHAPEGRVFFAALVRDFDGDGNKDAFAIVRPPEGNDPGELAFFRGNSRRGPLVASSSTPPPAGLAPDPACTSIDRLVRAGARAVFVELGTHCPPQPPRGPTRWVAVVAAPSSGAVRLPEGVRFAATVADPAGAPALGIEPDSSDRDGDGLPDVTLRVTLEGGEAPFEPGPRVSASFAWLDRPAGLSRDAASTDSSFMALASTAAVRARSAKDAPGVPGLVAQTRALWRAVCSDGGAPRVVGTAGSGAIACGGGRPLEELGLAEVRAYVTMGDPLRAALALERAERAPASRTAARMREATSWITPLAPTAMAKTVRAVSAVPSVARGREPAWGALAFETTGKLLVRTRAGVVRVDPDAGDEVAAEGVPAWPSGVVSLDGTMRWIESYDPCDGVALRASFAPTSGDDLRDVELPVAPPLGDRCAGSRGAPSRTLPIAWGPGGLEALVEGVPVLVAPDLSRASLLAAPLDSPPLLGGPRSPDGKVLVVPTAMGLVQRSPTRTRTLLAEELDGGTAPLRDCTTSSDGVHVACVRGERVIVGAWDPL